MKKGDGWLWAALAVIGALAYSRRASAAPTGPAVSLPPGGGGTAEPPREPEGGPMTSAADVFNRYRDLFMRYPGPMPIGVLAQIAWSESRGDPNAAARGNIPSTWVEPRRPFVEGGILQEAIDKSGDDYPTRYDFNPLSPEGAIYGRQKSIDYERRGLNTILSAGGYPKIETGSVPDAVIAMTLPHSIGAGAFRKVLSLAGPSRGRGLGVALAEWTNTPESNTTHPEYGSQTGVKVRQRVVKALGLPRAGGRVHPLPARLAPVAERSETVPACPAGLYERVKAMVPR